MNMQYDRSEAWVEIRDWMHKTLGWPTLYTGNGAIEQVAKMKEFILDLKRDADKYREMMAFLHAPLFIADKMEVSAEPSYVSDLEKRIEDERGYVDEELNRIRLRLDKLESSQLSKHEQLLKDGWVWSGDRLPIEFDHVDVKTADGVVHHGWYIFEDRAGKKVKRWGKWDEPEYPFPATYASTNLTYWRP